MTRRQFLAASAAAAAARALPAQRARAATLDPERLAKFIHPLLPIARAPMATAGRCRLVMRAADCQLHPDLPATRCWTYQGSFPGPLIEAQAGQPLQIEWVNALPREHFLPVDHTLEGAAAALPPVRAVVHLHGGRVPADSDGWPEAWTVPGQSQHCSYPNQQESALLFYHDHAMGLNRLNVYAGLAGLYLLRDDLEQELRLPADEFELPLALADRWLDPKGQLFYPTSGVPGRPWVPEVFGNCLLLNGQLWPSLQLEPRAYRLRLANLANGRFFRLSLAPLTMHLIGSDQGLLAGPVAARELLLAPAERADVIVDFRP
ncbi:MAG: multicopper oxidase family protein, partial [Terriglobales bacterium]